MGWLRNDSRTQGRNDVLLATSRHRTCVFLSSLVALLVLTACSDPESPDAQVRRVIDALEQAAEARDVGDLMRHVSTSYRDADGRDAKELSRYVRGYFIANQSIHLLTRVNSLEFPADDEARAHVTVAMVGREAAEANAWNLAAEIRDFAVTFRREDGDWKVTHARVDRPGGWP
jgi:uncharacterized lipoprotein YajG